MACKACITFLFGDAAEVVVPFDLQASSGDVEVAPWQPVLELAVPQGVAAGAGEGPLGFGCLDLRMVRDVGEGIPGIGAVAVAAAAAV
jgi:hypothetical protein